MVPLDHKIGSPAYKFCSGPGSAYSNGLAMYFCFGHWVDIGTGRIAGRRVLHAIMFTSTRPKSTSQNNDQRVF